MGPSANYVVAAADDFYFTFGTSAAAPVIGAMISNINDARLAAGKGPCVLRLSRCHGSLNLQPGWDLSTRLYTRKTLWTFTM